MRIQQIIERPVVLDLMEGCSISLVREDPPNEPVQASGHLDTDGLRRSGRASQEVDSPKKLMKLCFIHATIHASIALIRPEKC